MRTHRRAIPALLLAAFLVACGNGNTDGKSTNGTPNNGATNNSATNNGAPNGSPNSSTNNESPNNGSTNGSTNNASTNGSNNASTNGSTNNASTNGSTNNTNNTNNGTTAMCASQGECFSNEDCPADQRCQDVSTSDVEMPCCVVGPRGTGALGEMCDDENDCESGLCIQRNNDPFICSKSCDGQEDCPEELECHGALGLCVTP